MSTLTADDHCSAAQRSVEAGDWAEAEAEIARGLVLAPSHEELLKLKILVLLERGRWRRAGAALDDYAQVYPRPGTLHQSLDKIIPRFMPPAERLRLYAGVTVVVMIGLCVGAATHGGAALALAAAAVLIAITTVVEAIYRLALYAGDGIRGERFAYPENKSKPPFFVVQDRPSQRFDPERGYDLIPDSSFVRVGIGGARVVETHIGHADANGNSGHTDVESEDACINILILGDSYTSLPGNGCPGNDMDGVEWPYFFKKALAAAGIANVRVLNYGRSGHGVVQMADAAVSVLERHKPDVVVFAFNTLDLTRFRYWHKTVKVGGAMRCFRMQDPDAPFDQWAEEILIDPRITRDWAEERLRLRDTDTLLESIRRRFLHLRRRSSARAVDLLSPCRLYSWDRAFFGTPFLDIDAGRSPRLIWWKPQDSSFDGDVQFASAIRQIRASGAGIVLAHIPRNDDLIAGKTIFRDAVEPSLMKSLSAIAKEPIYRIGDQFKVDAEVVKRKYPRYPHDAHPSLWAQKLLGQGLAHLFLGPLAPKLKKRAAP